jgi:DNA polymerase II small subunit
MKEEILSVIKERGLLLERAVIDLLDSFHDTGVAREFLLNLERISGEKMISLKLLNNNVEFVQSVVKKMPGEEKGMLERTFVKMGISLEVRKEKEMIESNEVGKIVRKDESMDYKVFYADTKPDKKLEVRDFTQHFRARYIGLQKLLMNRLELQADLVSINKISGDRQGLSIIGIVTEKRITKNNNMIIKFEDLTGEISAVAKVDRVEIFEKADELQLDDIVGVKASGNKDMLFIHDIYYPDAFLEEKTRFEEDINIAFVSDIHCGSDKHLGKEFEKFLEWLNGKDEDAKKIKYIFFVGDNVDGVGIFPGQENVLELKSMVGQYKLLASYLRKVPERITMFMCPGQHDATRVAEPQPLISKKYADELYSIDNLVLVTNPCFIKLCEGSREFKILMYHGASMHAFVNQIKELRDIDVYKTPGKIVRHMLKRRHLAPMHGDVVYIPNTDIDPLLIKDVPDVLCTGEVHHLDIDSYNGVRIITGSCWQAMTDFEEKVGHVPDPCKVPIMNLKSGKMRVFDFTDKEEKGK